MARFSSDPLLLNETPTWSIKDLKDLGLLDGGCHRDTIKWRDQFGKICCTIEIIVDTLHAFPSIRFLYSCNGKDFDYLISLVRKKANSGICMVWYFQPEPGMYCKKLYMKGDFFVGRKQITGAYYRNQTLSGQRRNRDQYFARLCKLDKIMDAQNKRYFHYNHKGSHTKAALKIMAAKAELRYLAKTSL